MQAKERKLEQLIRMHWAHKLPDKLKFEACQQLIVSKMQYAKQLASQDSNKVAEQLRDFYYQ